MDAIITWAKGNYDLITLGVGILGVIISVISVIHAKRHEKQSKKEREASLKQSIRQKIAEKQAELNILKETTNFIDSTTMGNAFVRREVLSREIEELKKQL